MKKLKIMAPRVFITAVFLLLTYSSVTSTILYAGGEGRSIINAEELFQKAMKERSSGEYTASINTFQVILASRPELHRARLELAVSYYLSEQYEKALQAAEWVLNANDTPPDVRVAVLKFISQVNSEYQ